MRNFELIIVSLFFPSSDDFESCQKNKGRREIKKPLLIFMNKGCNPNK